MTDAPSACFDTLSAALHIRGVPPEHIASTVAKLRAHLTETGMMTVAVILGAYYTRHLAFPVAVGMLRGENTGKMLVAA
ncbi:hypothetical protein ACF08N_30915 [Streptomyces sp. NPDC015127]|uniref:hypothetical protein n=1 Tax=Streptomyces sp. NPDC015127 TaxID=3364939 RepID=UPI0036F553E4